MNTNKRVGRPRQPLSVGQRAYAEFAYRRRLKTQLDIAARLNVAFPRVRRHLIEVGLHKPITHGTAAHTAAVQTAVQMYTEGEPIQSIVDQTGLVVSEIYKAIHLEGIPLRSRKSVPVSLHIVE